MKLVGTVASVILLFSAVARAQHYQQTNLITNDALARRAQEMAYTVSAQDLAGKANVPAPPEVLPRIANCITADDTSAIVCRPPTSAVFNTGSNFAMATGKPALVIFVNQDGTISGWNPRVEAEKALPKVENKAHAVYDGAAIGKLNGVQYLYVANFRSREIEVYDPQFRRAKELERIFHGERLPQGFAPTNIQNVGGNLIVTYAKQDERSGESVAGEGLGIVDVFGPSGIRLIRLEQGTWLNAPRGIAQAPEKFGEFSNALLIGNSGSGQIAAYDLQSGQFIGLLKDARDAVLSVTGLWGLTASAPAGAGLSGFLLFSADVRDESGVFGMLTPVP